ncbi:MAG: methylenetetrahydrofolate reductase [NAD(P)H] [Verrucomicrobiae bacterium]|nr:methylenetetrahydrofolate reductase [NAD(P)H] [Verrucomicrobiae bacterium]
MRYGGQSSHHRAFRSWPPGHLVEFFPPKTEDQALQILSTANALARSFQPDFVSITYGAGGSTRERTLKYGRFLKEEYDWQVMPHLTCVGSSCEELAEILSGFHTAGFRNIMALRGDPPKGQTDFQPHPDGLRYGNELVAFIRERFDSFCLGVAGYPETHPQAPSPDLDIANLKRKVEAGASFVTTQMFFENDRYVDFVERARAAGITVPIMPGLMPLSSIKPGQTDFFGAQLPEVLRERLARAETPETQAKIGADWCYAQLIDLLERGAPGVHLYIMNRSQAALMIMERLKRDHPEWAGPRMAIA